MPLADLVIWFANRGVSGALTVERGTIKKQFTLQQGTAIRATPVANWNCRPTPLSGCRSCDPYGGEAGTGRGPRHCETGGMRVEYALIVAAIALGMIAVVKNLATALNSLYESITAALGTAGTP